MKPATLTAPLEVYMQHAFGAEAVYYQPSPLLYKDRVNRIVLYPGMFNPPHVGHWTQITACVRHGQDVLGVVAGIVYPHNDERVARKYRALDAPAEAIVFTKSERVEFWTAGERNGTLWISGHDDLAFSNALSLPRFRAAMDGLEIRYILLLGGDYIRTSFGLDLPSWDCEAYMTSDVARQVDFVHEGDATPRCLRGCTPWQLITGVDLCTQSGDKYTFYAGSVTTDTDWDDDSE